jgi:hypothetical protein
MRNKLNVLSLITGGLIFSIAFVVQSCGSAQQAGNEILRVGGISSTGNKDDEDGKTTQSAKQEQPQSMPIPGSAGLACEHPVDLSGSMYVLLAQQSTLQECADDQRSFACVDEIVFSTKEDATIRYRISGGDTLTVTATYRMCNLDLGIWTVDAEGSSKIDSFTSTEDVQILTHTTFGHSYQLTP